MKTRTQPGKTSVRHSVNAAVRLEQLRLFAGMTAEETAAIVRRIGGEVRRFSKGEVVVYEGTKAKWIVAVLSGRLTVFEPGANGVRHPVRVVESGHLFGATLVTMNLEYYPGMAVATEPSEVIYFDIARLRGVWRDVQCAKLFENLYTIVSAEVLSCWRKMSILSCKKTEDRFMLYLRWRASEVGEKDIRLPFARMEDCAVFLGVTRVSLSTAIGRLIKRGEIRHLGGGLFKLP